MKNIFTEHPKSIGETYWQHCGFAILFSLQMIIAGLACLIHAFLPFLFIKTGSNYLLKMIHNYIKRASGKEARIQELAQLLAEKCRE